MSLNETQLQFLREAIQISQEKMDQNEGGPFGAVIVRQGTIIARGWNRVTSTNDPTAHAEVVAIRAACHSLNAFHLQGCEIYCSCEPCPMCLSAIYWSHLDAIYFAATSADAAAIGFDDRWIYEELRRPHATRAIPMHQGARDAARAVFERWTHKPGRIEY